jgi:hypothetical protein
MPSVEDLPEELRPFAYRNALVLDSGVDFHHHADRLIAGIHELVDGGYVRYLRLKTERRVGLLHHGGNAQFLERKMNQQQYTNRPAL